MVVMNDRGHDGSVRGGIVLQLIDSKAGAEAVVKPDGMADDLWENTVKGVAGCFVIHRPTLPNLAQCDNA